MTLKYELTDETITTEDGVKLYRIRALRDIPRWRVKVGDFGGYIQTIGNLSQEGNAWVTENAQVYGNARINGEVRY